MVEYERAYNLDSRHTHCCQILMVYRLVVILGMCNTYDIDIYTLRQFQIWEHLYLFMCIIGVNFYWSHSFSWERFIPQGSPLGLLMAYPLSPSTLLLVIFFSFLPLYQYCRLLKRAQNVTLIICALNEWIDLIYGPFVFLVIHSILSISPNLKSYLRP